MGYKHYKHFGIILMASFAVHLFVLTALFALPESNDNEEYKTVRVRLGVQNQELTDAIARARQYASYEPGAGPSTQQASAGNSIKNVPDIPASAKEKIKQDKPEQQEPLQKKSMEPVSSKDKPFVEKPSNLQELQVKKMAKKVAQKTEKVPPLPVIKRAEEHWSEEGVVIGNSLAENTEIVSTYEAILPLWLNKFKKYPQAAKDERITGKGVLFIKIDRKGKVFLAKVIDTTGHLMLDRAIMNMIAAADPVLPVPLDYHPDRRTFSYKILVEFDESEL